MGTTDKSIRILAAVVMVVLYYTNILSGMAAIVPGILAIVFLLTSLISFCSLYLPLGINTRKRKNK